MKMGGSLESVWRKNISKGIYFFLQDGAVMPSSEPIFIKRT
jgi:hypothetical protein